MVKRRDGTIKFVIGGAEDLLGREGGEGGGGGRRTENREGEIEFLYSTTYNFLI